MKHQLKPARERRRGGWVKRRVVYRVERLPEELRALVDRGLAQGKSYRQIRSELKSAGEKIGMNSLSRYWRNRWQRQQRWLQWVNAQSEAVAQALRQSGESNEAILARKLLLTAVFSRMKELRDFELLDLLRETREMVKATRHLDTKKSAGAQPTLSPAERRRRVREIYGWPEEELEAPARGAEKANP